ncbi:MAG: hypothetical protein WC130_03590 [Kiritimatiellia bacterium]
MTYSVDNPPKLLSTLLAGNGQLWYYEDGDDAATVAGAGYITNAKDLGMKAADLVIVHDTTTPLTTMHRVETIAANGSSNLTAATTIAATT